MALRASEWCEGEGSRSLFNPLLQHFHKGAPRGAHHQTDAKLMRRIPKVTIGTSSPTVRPHHHSGLASEVELPRVEQFVHFKWRF